MKVLFATGEVWPFVKTGGLGDVAYSLPKELMKMDIDVRVVLPKYSQIEKKFRDRMKKIGTITINLGWRETYCGIEFLEHEGVKYYFIDNEYYFKRDNIYGEYDDCERFSFFSKAILEIFEDIDFRPDLIHCNDWHTGLVSVYLNELREEEEYKKIKTLYTIHNLKYQGVFSRDNLGDTVDLPFEKYYQEEGIKFYDNISFMKGGIIFSDFISTVSETYSNEIKSEFYGENLEGLFRVREEKLKGIVNGIDYDLFNPRRDKEIYKKFSQSKFEDKIYNKLELQKNLGLEVDKDLPMIGIITRLTPQKGIDLIINVLQEMLEDGVQVVLLGNGDESYEDVFKYYADRYPNRLSSNITFNHELAKKIYASSDMFLMPSLFEPCGLSQLISMRYGTVPIVRETGGLKDTVEPYNIYEDTGTGFTFTNYNAHEMLDCIRRSIEVYKDSNKWKALALRGMKRKSSWNHSAKEYKKLYKNILG